jgi:low temperature requirement protein LtrA
MAARDRLLRVRGDSDARVSPIELFFDLVYVLAVTQLTHQLLTHLTLRGAAETLLLLLAVWTDGCTPRGSRAGSIRPRCPCA